MNPQLLVTIDTEFSKVEGQSPPSPIRFSADVAAAGSGSGGGKGGGDALDELFPRVDLDKLISGTSILTNAKSDAWKTRKEALEMLVAILDAGPNKRLKPTMTDIGQVLKARVADSNKIVQALTLDIVSRIASGMNKPFEKQVRIFARPVAEVLADQKATTRTAATSTLTAMATACESIDAFVHPLAGALESANPILRSSLLTWMGECVKILPPPPSVDVTPWAGPVVACLDDKNGDVRKAAQALLPFLISQAGYDCVVSKTNNMKAASRSAVLPMLQNAKSVSKPAAPPPTVEPPKAPKASPSIPPVVASAAEDYQADAGPAPKRAPPNLRMRKIEPASRSESRAESISEAALRPNGASKPTSRAPSTLPPSPNDNFPFRSSSLDIKRSRLNKDGPRWIIEGLPVRKDLADTLRSQMESSVSVDLINLLFSKDHTPVNSYVKGLGIVCDAYSQVSEDDEETKTALLANSDMMLKYVSIKIHEPQPNLIVRCLDVLDSIIALMTVSEYTISEHEALCFIPTVIHKAST